MRIPNDIYKKVPSVDIYDSWELVTRHMPIEQPPATASYIIFKKGTKIYAKNGLTGHIEYEDTDASTVIQAAINAIANKQGKIFIKNGTYYITKTLDFSNVSNYTVFEGESMGGTMLKLADGANTDIIKNSPSESRYFFTIRNLRIFGNRNNNTTGRGIVLGDYAYDVIMENVYIEETPRACLYTTEFWGYRISKCIFERSNETDYAVRIGGHSGAFIHCRFGNHPNAKANLLVEAKYTDIIACEFETGGEIGLWITMPYVHVIGGYTRNNGQKAANTYPGMRIGVQGNAVIMGHTFDGSNQEKYGLEIVSNSPNNIVIGNQFFDHATAPISDSGTDTIIKYNRGYTTENSGTATIASGSTSVTVAHGLANTPSKVIVTPRGNVGAVWVSSRDTTNITIECETAPSADTLVDWYAEL